MKSKRTQAERSAATRAALVEAARPLFAEQGYAAVSTDQIARVAGVTRGALYHQFSGKEELFAAVFEQVEAEIAERIGAQIAAVGPDDLLATMRASVDAWLEACADPAVQRIALLDAPAALGWARWREIGLRYGLGVIELGLTAAIDGGLLPEQPVRPLAHVLAGALDEAALYCATAEDRAVATEEARAALVAVITGLVGDTPG
ncbi:AcrR family transcriptional regulator [Nocardioides thalensis]|uniref:AcrR family transcriptional regulator n=1 Tax=Nocardioides thalensis TaxID=1914755 RepID=A0A853C3Y9_9ACTN|nr:TetR/AcrR family transcriptional regulator [Nocardioides thalensis]NYJ02019.1 AcrR family transcriptional regulator [Nocardioides thalensis]